jgi:hypothetical protein
MIRFHALELSYVPGRQQEAYDKLRALYALGGNNIFNTGITRMIDLEAKLNIPYPRRIPEAKPGRKKPSAFRLSLSGP